MFVYNSAINKARSVKQGDMVSWNASGGKARGKVIRVVRDGTLSVPDTSFQLKGDSENPAVLIQLYRDGEPTDRQVGHKMSALTKSLGVLKHGSHDQKTHGKGGKGGSGSGGGGKYEMEDAMNATPADVSRRAELMHGTNSKQFRRARALEAESGLEAKAQEAGKSDTQISQGMKAGFLTAARATKKPEGFAGLLDSAKSAYEKPQSGDFIGGMYVGMLNAKSLFPDVFGS